MTRQSFSAFWDEYGDKLIDRLGEHIFLALASTLIASCLGVCLALLAFRQPRLKTVLLSVVGIIQTIPSLALLALLLALFQKIGPLPAMIALILYALLPVVRGTLTGLETIPPILIEAARGIGMTPWQRLSMVRLPLALPQIVSGIRVAANIGVGIATIAAFVGAGGLGQFINRGLFLNDTKLILLGAIPAALLALLIDQMIAQIEHSWFSRGWRSSSEQAQDGALRRWFVLSLPLLLFALGTYAAYGRGEAVATEGKIVIGTKNFTEQIILGELIAQTIERHSHLAVERRFGLGGSLILHQAVVSGEIDLYPEYTGTALAAILKEDGVPKAAVMPHMREVYAERYKLHVFDPLGFDNSYVLIMRKPSAAALGITALSDLKRSGPKLKAGVDFEFAERKDGFRGLKERFGIGFASVQDIDPNLLYSVLADGQVDVISGYATDGRIDSYGFQALRDDLDFFPPYQAVIVARQASLAAHPEVAALLQSLSGRLDDATMRRLNGEVDAGHKNPAAVAGAFLDTLEAKGR